jgi:hypothetical protein
MKTSQTSLRDECELLVLRPGDMIVDTTINNAGILVECERRISMLDDDVYFWTVHWAREPGEERMPFALQIEEEGLKISIVVGLYDLFRAGDIR